MSRRRSLLFIITHKTLPIFPYFWRESPYFWFLKVASPELVADTIQFWDIWVKVGDNARKKHMLLVVCSEEFIIGRVIKAMNCSWHPNCFLCELCDAPLADAGFIKSAGRYMLVYYWSLSLYLVPLPMWEQCCGHLFWAVSACVHDCVLKVC